MTTMWGYRDQKFPWRLLLYNRCHTCWREKDQKIKYLCTLYGV